MIIRTLAAASLALTFAATASTAQEPKPGETIHVPAFDLPLSDALSPEARAYFAARPKTPPPMGAAGQAKTKAEFDAATQKYYAVADEMFVKPLYEQTLKIYPVKETVTRLGDVPVADYEPAGGVAKENANRVLLNLRGGGFGPVNSAYTGRLASVPVASLGKIRVVTVLHKDGSRKYPAATEDAVAVYQELLKRYPAKNIGIYGCSAGAILTSATTAWLIDKNIPLPAAISIAGAGMSMDPAYASGDSTYFAAIGNGAAPPAPGAAPTDPGGFRGPFGYLAGVDLNTWLANPMTDPVKLSKFPPTMLMTATRDGFSSTLRAHRALYRAGVPVELHVFDGLPHCFTTQTTIPEAREGSEVIYKWFDRQLGR